MARRKLIEDDDLVKLIERYFREELCEYSQNLTTPNISKYLKRYGYEVESRIIKRCKPAMDKIEELKSYSVDYNLSGERPIAFVPLDINEMINLSKDQLRKSLVNRETYYKEIYEYANNAMSKTRVLVDELTSKTKELESLKNLVEVYKNKKSLYRDKNNDLLKENQVLTKVVDKYVNPAIAEELLKKEGLLPPTTETIVTSDDFDSHIIHADSNIQSELSNLLMSNFEEEEHES